MERYNHEYIGNIYQEELQEHVQEMNQLHDHLKDVTTHCKETYTKAGGQLEDKREAIDKTKDFIHQALARLAYSLSMATQKLDDGLRLQTEGIEQLSRRTDQLSLMVEIRREQKDKKSILELTTIKQPPNWNLIKMMEDPTTNWTVPKKYYREDIDLTVMDNMGMGKSPSSPTSDVHAPMRRVSMQSSVVETLRRESMRPHKAPKKVSMPMISPRQAARTKPEEDDTLTKLARQLSVNPFDDSEDPVNPFDGQEDPVNPFNDEGGMPPPPPPPMEGPSPPPPPPMSEPAFNTNAPPGGTSSPAVRRKPRVLSLIQDDEDIVFDPMDLPPPPDTPTSPLTPPSDLRMSMLPPIGDDFDFMIKPKFTQQISVDDIIHEMDELTEMFEEDLPTPPPPPPMNGVPPPPPPPPF